MVLKHKSDPVISSLKTLQWLLMSKHATRGPCTRPSLVFPLPLHCRPAPRRITTVLGYAQPPRLCCLNILLPLLGTLPPCPHPRLQQILTDPSTLTMLKPSWGTPNPWVSPHPPCHHCVTIINFLISWGPGLFISGFIINLSVDDS